MIRQSCVYCGKKVRGPDSLAGQQAKCPACGHLLRIRPPQKTARAESGDETTPGEQRPGLNWTGKSDREIAESLPLPLTEREIQLQATKASVAPLLPHYDDLTLFTLSLTLVLLLLVNTGTQQDIIRPLLVLAEGRILLLFGAACVGMVFSLLGVFFRSRKPETIKWLMLIFAVLVSGGTGVYAGYIALKATQGWLIIFPAWNILTGGLLLLTLTYDQWDPNCIIDKPATTGQIVLTVVTACIIVGVCQYGFEMHWAITYSICVGYITNLHHTLGRLFKKATSRREPALEEQAK